MKAGKRRKGTCTQKDRLEFLVLYVYGLQISNMSDSDRSTGDTGYIAGDDSWTQWRNIFAILTGNMTAEGIDKFRVARDIRNEAADCKRCEDQRDYLLQYSWF